MTSIIKAKILKFLITSKSKRARIGIYEQDGEPFIERKVLEPFFEDNLSNKLIKLYKISCQQKLLMKFLK